MKKKHQSKVHKSNHKFEIVRGQELLVRVPLPMAEVWAEMQAQLKHVFRSQFSIYAWAIRQGSV